MTIHALLDSVKKLQVKIQTQVIELKDLKDDKVGNEDNDKLTVLETEMQKIAMEKERRDRVGPFLSQILCNISCRISENHHTD